VSPICAQKRTLLLAEMIDRAPACFALAIILPTVTLWLPRCAAHTQALAFPIATEVDDRVLQKRPSLLGRRPSFFGRNVPGKDGFGPCWEFLYASETLHRPYTCSAPPRLAVLQGSARRDFPFAHTIERSSHPRRSLSSKEIGALLWHPLDDEGAEFCYFLAGWQEVLECR
jgi:hypothetical protein